MTARSRSAEMRAMFAGYLTVILLGLAYFFVVGLSRL